MSADFLLQGFLYVLLIVFIVLFTIVSCKWQDEVYRRISIEEDYDTLFERSVEICDELIKSEELVITQNKIIKDLQFNHATEFVKWLDEREAITLRTYNFKTLYCHFKGIQ